MPFDFDPRGENELNVVTEEFHSIPQRIPDTNHRIIIPKKGPVFLTTAFQNLTVSVVNGANTTSLVQGEDWKPIFLFKEATHTTAKQIWGGINIVRGDLVGVIRLDYHSVGDVWELEPSVIEDIYNTLGPGLSLLYWEQVANYPEQFPVIDHPHEESDFVGMSDVVDAIMLVVDAINNRPAGVSQADLTAHSQLTDDRISAFQDLLATNVLSLDVRVSANTTAISAHGDYINDNRVRFGTVALLDIASPSLTDTYRFDIVDGPSGIVRQSFHPADAHSIYHVVGNISEIRLAVSSTMHVGKIHKYLYRGTNPNDELLVTVDGNDIVSGSPLFVTYNQETQVVSTDTHFIIDVFNKEYTFYKRPDGSIQVVF